EAREFIPVGDVSVEELARAAQLSSLADETPEGRSIVIHAEREYELRERAAAELSRATFVSFTAQTRMSGVDLDDGAPSPHRIRKGAAASVVEWVRDRGGD